MGIGIGDWVGVNTGDLRLSKSPIPNSKTADLLSWAEGVVRLLDVSSDF